jgi:hypothetical protein
MALPTPDQITSRAGYLRRCFIAMAQEGAPEADIRAFGALAMRVGDASFKPLLRAWFTVQEKAPRTGQDAEGSVCQARNPQRTVSTVKR